LAIGSWRLARGSREGIYNAVKSTKRHEEEDFIIGGIKPPGKKSFYFLKLNRSKPGD
jgi:hypothetical protein